MTEAIWPIVLPLYWLQTDPVTRTLTTATVSLLVNDVAVEDFEWGWPQRPPFTVIKLNVNVAWPPDPPPGVDPGETPRLDANFMQCSRFRSDTLVEVNRSGGTGSAALGQIWSVFEGSSRNGPTGYFRVQFPSDYAGAGVWVHTPGLYEYELYPDDVNFPGVNVETPLTYKARPSVGVSGQLLTAIDGGAP